MMCCYFQLLQGSENFLEYLGNWELVMWCMALAIYLLRFMTLGTKINKKYRNFSVLITEQVMLNNIFIDDAFIVSNIYFQVALYIKYH